MEIYFNIIANFICKNKELESIKLKRLQHQKIHFLYD
jgi:hypothetical protein